MAMLGHATYLVFEVGWALPVLALQWIVGRRRLRQRWRTLLLAVTVATLYLACADGVAIANGIWTLHADRIVGVRIVDVPIEEIIFFFLTNAMVVQSILVIHPEPSTGRWWSIKSMQRIGSTDSNR